MKKYVIHDVLEAYAKEGDSDYFFGLTTAANINKTITQEILRAGIGNKAFYVINMDGDFTFDITAGLHYQEVYEMQTGQKFEASSEITYHKIEEGVNGEVTVAEETTAAGEVLEFEAGSFPKSMHVQLRTIAYDVDTQEKAADILYVFPKAVPDGNINEAFGAGANKTTDITFTALVPTGKTSYGQMIIIPVTPVTP